MNEFELQDYHSLQGLAASTEFTNPLTLKKMGAGKVIAIFWTINDPPGLQGLIINRRK